MRDWLPTLAHLLLAVWAFTKLVTGGDPTVPLCCALVVTALRGHETRSSQ